MGLRQNKEKIKFAEDDDWFIDKIAKFNINYFLLKEIFVILYILKNRVDKYSLEINNLLSSF